MLGMLLLGMMVLVRAILVDSINEKIILHCPSEVYETLLILYVILDRQARLIRDHGRYHHHLPHSNTAA